MKLFVAALAMLMLGQAWAADESPTSRRGPTVTGEVLDVKPSGGFTYLWLRTPEGDTWAVVGKAPLKKGDAITLENTMVVNDFESMSLKRKFDRIVFGKLVVAGAAPTGGFSGKFHGGARQIVDSGDIRVARAPGREGRTIAEIYAKASELKDKPVAVRGKVVKATAAVMGKYWLHLRDGSGSEKAQTHDLIVATKERAKVGDVVIAKGVVRTDVDLGGGYAYKLLVDEAALQK